jgi:hypothetical protein
LSGLEDDVAGRQLRAGLAPTLLRSLRSGLKEQLPMATNEVSDKGIIARLVPISNVGQFAIALVGFGVTVAGAIGYLFFHHTPSDDWAKTLETDELRSNRVIAAQQLAECGPTCTHTLPSLQRVFSTTDGDDGLRTAVAGAVLKVDPTGGEEDVIAYLRGRLVRAEQGRGVLPEDAIVALDAAGSRASSALPALRVAHCNWAGSTQYRANVALEQIEGVSAAHYERPCNW